jgi:cobalamin biosynthesis protein CobD/CbiB
VAFPPREADRTFRLFFGDTAETDIPECAYGRRDLRDGKKHPSPNSGLAEAAVAGALDVQLGGLNYYFGEPSMRPTLGDPVKELGKKCIVRANALMFVILILATIILLAVRFSLTW